MSALDPAQAAKRIVYCYDPGTGVAETKGGVAWGLGDDGTGTGTPALPYATLDGASKAVRTFEGADFTSQEYEFRLVTDPAEDSDYGTVVHNDATHIGTQGPVLSYVGWLKTFGDPDYGDKSGKWASTDDIPKLDHYNRVSSGSDFEATVWKNIEFTNTSANNADVYSHSTSRNQNHRFYGCVFSGSSSKAGNLQCGVNHQLGGSSEVVGYFACIFLNAKVQPDLTIFISDGDKVSLVNCYFKATNDDAIRHGTGSLSQARAFVLSSIFNISGIGNLCYFNDQNTDISNSAVRDNNRYWLQSSAQFAKWSSSLSIENNFSPSALYDLLGSEGDPDIVGADDPTLNDTSLVLDKGSGPFTALFTVDDISGNGYDTVDALNFPWGDSVDGDTASAANNNASFSQRGVGPIQNARGMVTPEASVASPINIISFGPLYLAAKIKPDPDGVGTVQPRFLQADNVGMDTNLVILDAWPLNITTSDNKINFKEDAGAERTATISTGIKNTADLIADIKTALEAAPSSVGTYTVNYNAGTKKIEISVAGGATTVQFLWASGTDIANAAYRWTGFRPVDTADQASHTADDPTLENFYDAARVYEFSTDYDGESDPGVSGTWNDLGTGDPSDAGVEGVDGVDAEGVDRWARTDFNNKSAMFNKFHSVQFCSGTFKSAAVGPA